MVDVGLAVAATSTQYFAPYKVQAWDSIPAEPKDPDGKYWAGYTGIISVGWNKDKFGDIASLDDLLDPKFAGTASPGVPVSRCRGAASARPALCPHPVAQTAAVSVPFFLYTAAFLLLPALIVIVGAFQSADGRFTLSIFNRRFEANTVHAFGTSLMMSLLSAVIGSVVGALAAYALVIDSSARMA